MDEEQYLTEKHYLVCTEGAMPKRVKVTSQDTTMFSGHLAATEADTQRQNIFTCLSKTAFIAGVFAGIASIVVPIVLLACAAVPGPGWLVAGAIITVGAVGAVGVAHGICGSTSTQRKWEKPSEVLKVHGYKTLLLSSQMICPKGGLVTPKETFWAAWGSASLTNLGHLANFGFGILAGRGMATMAIGATGAAGGVGALFTRQGAVTAAKEFGRQFLNTARTELGNIFNPMTLTQKMGWGCRILRGLGIGANYYNQYNIWSSDKGFLDKLLASGMGLVWGIFAAKGATTVCFPAGTKIHTENGLVNIEKIQAGEKILTYNEATGKQEYKPVIKIHQRFTLQMMTIELPTGEMLEVTPEHRFYNNNVWVEARELQVGDTLQLKNGDYTTITGIELFPKTQKVYNFDVLNNENYYVTEDGILVHNGYGDVLKPEAKYLKGGKHGVKWTEGGALAKKTGIPQGQWGSVSDLEFAGNRAATLNAGEGAYFELPAGHQSLVHMPDGSIQNATHIWVRNNGSGTFHGYPLIK